nr:hypothetical protein CFP56_52132 [Quercus suber]
MDHVPMMKASKSKRYLPSYQNKREKTNSVGVLRKVFTRHLSSSSKALGRQAWDFWSMVWNSCEYVARQQAMSLPSRWCERNLSLALSRLTWLSFADLQQTRFRD